MKSIPGGMMFKGQKIKQHMRYLAFVVFGFFLITSYQNCDGQLQTQDQISSSVIGSNSSSSTSDSGSGSGVTTVDPEQLKAACKPLMGKPIIASPTQNILTVGSGAGKGAGDIDASSVLLSVNKGITNQTQSNTLGCTFSTNVMCEIVSNDSSKSPVLSHAVDASGADLTLTASTDALKAGVFQKAISTGNRNCAGAVDANSQRNVMLANNRSVTDVARCVEGSVWVKITAQTLIDNTTKSVVSDPVYLKVNLQNKCWDESRLKQVNVELPSLALYGSATAIDGNWAASIAPNEDYSSSITRVGSLYIYKKTNQSWSFFQKIMIGDAAMNDTLTSVAIKGDRLAVSSSLRNSKMGSVFIYSFNGTSWISQQTLKPETPNDIGAQKFGASLALSDTTLAIGASEYSTVQGSVNRAGAVHVYSCSASSCKFKYIIVSPGATYGFGSSLSLDGNNLAIGAPQAVTQESFGKGFVSVYDISGTTEATLIKKIEPTDGDMGMKFGASVSLLGTKLAIGAPLKTNTIQMVDAAESGAVYYYSDFNTGVVSKIFPGSEASGNYGQAVGFGSSGLFASCPFCNARSGVVTYRLLTRLLTTNAGPDFSLFGLNKSSNDGFGGSLAVSGTDIIIGAPIKNDSNTNSGAAYIYLMK